MFAVTLMQVSVIPLQKILLSDMATWTMLKPCSS